MLSWERALSVVAAARMIGSVSLFPPDAALPRSRRSKQKLQPVPPSAILISIQGDVDRRTYRKGMVIVSDFNRDNNRAVWFDIPVVDLERATAFYSAVLAVKQICPLG